MLINKDEMFWYFLYPEQIQALYYWLMVEGAIKNKALHDQDL